MKENTYYMTTADCIYGMIRKTLIYVKKIRKKTFVYYQVEWISNENNQLQVIYFRLDKRVGKLTDVNYFREQNTTY